MPQAAVDEIPRHKRSTEHDLQRDVYRYISCSTRLLVHRGREQVRGRNVAARRAKCNCAARASAGALLDRIDIHVDVPPVECRQLASRPSAEPSSAIRERVHTARNAQLRRSVGEGSYTNARMSIRHAPTTRFSRSHAPSPTGRADTMWALLPVVGGTDRIGPSNWCGTGCSVAGRYGRRRARDGACVFSELPEGPTHNHGNRV